MGRSNGHGKDAAAKDRLKRETIDSRKVLLKQQGKTTGKADGKTKGGDGAKQ